MRAHIGFFENQAKMYISVLCRSLPVDITLKQKMDTLKVSQISGREQSESRRKDGRRASSGARLSPDFSIRFDK